MIPGLLQRRLANLGHRPGHAPRNFLALYASNLVA
jgi:hypothetical protein